MNYRLLGSTGLRVSALSFGASSLGGVFHPVDEDEGIRAVHAALDGGINYLDVSPYYGATRAETVLGRALRQVARDRYLLSTKVGQYGEGEFDFSAARVLREFDASCARLGVDHVDLLLCHDIEFADLDQIAGETLPALVRLRAAGRVRHLGVSGLPLKIFPAIIDRVGPGIVEVILSFCHYELNDSSLISLLPYLRSRGVGIINASPTGMGLLTERGVPAWHPASAAIVAGCRQAVDFCRSQGQDIMKAAIQHSISHPGIATTLFSTASPAHVERNLAYAREEVDHRLIARLGDLLAPIHNHNFTRGRPENRDAPHPA